MPNCTVESWKMKDIAVALSKHQYNDKKIVIPRFGLSFSVKKF